MSEENVELARRALKASVRRDRTAWLPLHDQDLEVVPIPDWPEPGVRGREAAWDFFVELFDAFDRFPVDDAELVDAGPDKVLLHYRFDVSGRGSGAGVEVDYWNVVIIRQGRIFRSQFFADRAEALEAAGLSEEALSEENIELASRMYEAWNEGGAQAAKQFWAEDIEFHDPPDLPDSRVVRGRDALAAYLTRQSDAVGDWKLNVLDARGRGECVVVRMELTVHGTGSGLDVPGELMQVVELANGKVQRARGFFSWKEALEAAGLSG